MLKITKISVTIVILYIFVYVQIWDDNHLILYGAALITVASLIAHWFSQGYVDFSYVPYGIWNNLIMVAYSLLAGLFVAYSYPVLVSSCITYAAFSVICVAICYISTEEESFEWVFDLLIIIAIICAIYLLGFGANLKGYGKILSDHNNPHVLAAIMNLGIFSTAFKFSKHSIRELIISALLITLFLFCTVESGSRKYLIANACLVAIWALSFSIYLWKSNNPSQRLLLIIMLLVISILLVYYFRNIYGGTMIHSRMADYDDLGNVNRVLYYQKALDIFREHPLLGGGYDQFQYWSETGSYSHSTYAETIADFGILGCSIYYTPIILTLGKSIRKALVDQRDYKSVLLLAFCLVELFIGIGQIFFMAFQHFIVWSILFYYNFTVKKETTDSNTKVLHKYIRK